MHVCACARVHGHAPVRERAIAETSMCMCARVHGHGHAPVRERAIAETSMRSSPSPYFLSTSECVEARTHTPASRSFSMTARAITAPCKGSVDAPGSSRIASMCPPEDWSLSAASSAALHDLRCAVNDEVPASIDWESTRSVEIQSKKSTLAGHLPSAV